MLRIKHALDSHTPVANRLRGILLSALTKKGHQPILTVMKTLMEKVRGEALRLPVDERASLAHELILSLDAPSAYELSPSVEKEIARRAQSVREGTASSRTTEDVFKDIEAKYP